MRQVLLGKRTTVEDYESWKAGGQAYPLRDWKPSLWPCILAVRGTLTPSRAPSLRSPQGSQPDPQLCGRHQGRPSTRSAREGFVANQITAPEPSTLHARTRQPVTGSSGRARAEAWAALGPEETTSPQASPRQCLLSGVLQAAPQAGCAAGRQLPDLGGQGPVRSGRGTAQAFPEGSQGERKRSLRLQLRGSRHRPWPSAA